MSTVCRIIESLSVVQEVKSPEHGYLKSKGWDYDPGPGEYHHSDSNHVILFHNATGQHHVGGGARFGKKKTIAVGTAQQAHHMAMNA